MASPFQHISFRGDSRGPIKKLSGFLKHHRLPEMANPTTTAFIRRAGEAMVSEETQDLFRSLRTAFAYKRRDVVVSEEVGLSDIMTPDFTAHLRLEIYESDPRQWSLALEVDEVKHEQSLHSEAFEAVFRARFDRVVCVATRPLSVEDIIDRVESMEDPDSVTVDYPHDASACEVTLAGHSTTLLVESGAITLQGAAGITIAELLKAAAQLPRLLGLDPDTRLLGG